MTLPDINAGCGGIDALSRVIQLYQQRAAAEVRKTNHEQRRGVLF
ncbi:hypothetical protein [Klebsiella pneumoniae]